MNPALAALTAVLLAALPAAASAREAPPAAAPVFTPSTMPYPFSSAVRVGDVLYLSGEIGATDDFKAVVPGGIGPETERMFERISQTLARHGLGFKDLFKCTVFLADMKDWPAFNAIYARHFQPGRYPARSALGVNGLALGAKVEMECWAWAGGERPTATASTSDPLDRALQTLALIAIEDDTGHREFTVTRFATTGCITAFSGNDAELKVDWSKTAAAGLSDGFLFVHAPPQHVALLIDPERSGEWEKLGAVAGVLERKVTECGGKAGPVR